ncbi:hypothetical protein MKW98_000415 [Papaver atlanticum]|uniref:Uncharacterized protein n=1 Tax=Papaver atlanticum TaxID=357466 RepID=A0AAD4S408_9MAGN|nr:hypothetical protein MKW98_000415 [Papaver atlanticum]
MEEERARQEAAAKKTADEAAKQGGESSNSQDATMTENVAADDVKGNDQMDEETALLQQTLSMSMGDPVSSHSGKSIGNIDMMDASTDDQELGKSIGDVDMMDAIQTIKSWPWLPGVDPNDPSVKDLLASLQGQGEPQKKDEDQSKEEEKK